MVYRPLGTLSVHVGEFLDEFEIHPSVGCISAGKFCFEFGLSIFSGSFSTAVRTHIFMI